MKAVSLWQPWATAALTPDLKQHETRSWAAPAKLIGQRIAIHASKTSEGCDDCSLLVDRAMAWKFGDDWMDTLPRGALLGTAILSDCRQMGQLLDGAEPAHENDRLFGDWEPGRWAWRLTDIEVAPAPIPWRGEQGVFAVPDDVFAKAREAFDLRTRLLLDLEKLAETHLNAVVIRSDSNDCVRYLGDLARDLSTILTTQPGGAS